MVRSKDLRDHDIQPRCAGHEDARATPCGGPLGSLVRCGPSHHHSISGHTEKAELFPVALTGFVALCIRCHRNTTAPTPVRWIESTSGPGTTLYACPDHAPELGAGPTPDDVIGAS